MPEFVLRKFLPYRLSLLSNRISNDLARLYSDRHQLAVSEWRVVAILARHPKISARTICQYSAIDKVAVSRAVARLIGRCLVRKRPDPEDRRSTILSLSEAGKVLYRDIAPRVLALEKTLLGCFSVAEKRQFSQLLDKLAAREEALPRI